jgi:hypothetical protein
MAQSTGIMLTVGTISFGNEWLQTGTPNFRIPVATLLFAWFLDGVEHIYPRAAIGLASIALITVVITPLNGKSPLQEALEILPTKPRK